MDTSLPFNSLAAILTHDGGSVLHGRQKRRIIGELVNKRAIAAEFEARRHGAPPGALIFCGAIDRYKPRFASIRFIIATTLSARNL